MKLPRPLVQVFALALALAPSFPVFAADAPKKVLVVTVTTGFRHSCIPVSEKIIAQLARESGKFTVDFVRQPEGQPKAPARPRPGPAGANDPAHQAALKKFAEDEKAYNATWSPKIEAALQKLSPANLKNYDAVLFASTTGDLPLPDKQGFIDWIASGKAFIGVHAATDTFHNSGAFPGFAPYVAMIGGAFRTHGPQVTVECINQDPAHAACKPLPNRWTVHDEIYQLKEFDRAKVHSLISLEKLALNQSDKDAKKETPGDFPIAWSKMHGKGRVFYTSLGHREDMWDPTFSDKDGRKNSPEVAKQFQQHLLGGILWSLGLAPGSAIPQKK
jgi:type 1 glutamine amidotransferase